MKKNKETVASSAKPAKKKSDEATKESLKALIKIKSGLRGGYIRRECKC